MHKVCVCVYMGGETTATKNKENNYCLQKINFYFIHFVLVNIRILLRLSVESFELGDIVALSTALDGDIGS